MTICSDPHGAVFVIAVNEELMIEQHTVSVPEL
jgi:acetate kinase